MSIEEQLLSFIKSSKATVEELSATAKRLLDEVMKEKEKEKEKPETSTVLVQVKDVRVGGKFILNKVMAERLLAADDESFCYDRVGTDGNVDRCILIKAKTCSVLPQRTFFVHPTILVKAAMSELHD
jgi:hypothetical protein